MNILFLSSWFPYPANNGSRLRVSALLHGLAQRHDVTLISFGDEHDLANAPRLRQVCRAIHVVPQRVYNPASARAVLSLVSPTPRSIMDTYVPEMAERIRRELAQRRYDLVIASQQATAGYAAAFAGVPSIFEEVELGVFETRRAQATSHLARLRGALTIVKLQHYLRRLLPAFSACTVVSRAEHNLVTQLIPKYEAVEVVPNCVDLTRYAGHASPALPETLIYTGAFTYKPNYDAMTWFVGNVLPQVRARVPDAQLTITGDHAHLPLPAANNVTVTGLVDDIRPLVARSTVALAPLREGGGTRLKILEAMALGTPVVATSKGAEGLDVENGRHLLIADSAEDFAAAVVRVLTEPGLRAALAAEAYRLVADKYNWQTILPRFTDLAERVAHG